MTTYAENDTVNLITRMPAGLRRQLKHYATERDTSMSKLVTQAVEELVARAAERGGTERAAAGR
jgi:predicted transcriptional regulator